MDRKRHTRAYRGGLALIGLAIAALVLLLSLGMGRSGADFSRSTVNTGNTFTAGSIALSSSTPDGTAVFTASGLLPGGSANGTVTIDLQSTFSAGVTLTGASDGAAVAHYLTLKIEDVTGTPATTLWTGYMSDFTSLTPLSLGTWATGTSKSYKFTVTFPANTTAGPDVQNASTFQTLTFTGVVQ